MTYAELLNKPEWSEKCAKILQRDHFKCQNCGKVGFHNSLAFTYVDKMSDVYKLANTYKYLPEKLDLTFQELYEAHFIDSFFKLSNDERSSCWSIINCKANLKKIAKIEEYNAYMLENIEIISFPKLLGREQRHKLILYGIRNLGDGDKLFFSKKCLHEINFKYLRLLTKSSNLSSTILPLNIIKFGETISEKCIVSIYQDTNTLGTVILSVNYGYYSYKFHLNQDDVFIPGLNIHHKYYITGLNPWEYDDNALVTLCSDCHEEFHNNNNVPIYASKEKNAIIGAHPTNPVDGCVPC